MEKISVIVPVYNTHLYLKECLDSIINQTYQNLEIILINDASPYEEDDIICKEYVKKDNRIKYIRHKENKGAGGAKQTGINHSSGKYITFVDSDDYLINNNLYSICINKFKNQNIDIVSFYSTIEKNRLLNKLIKKVYINEHNIIRDAMTTLTSKIFKADLIKKIKFNENIRYDDIPYWFEFCIVNKPVIYKTGITGYYYRENINSITQNKNNNYKMIETFNEVLNLADKYKCDINKIHYSIADLINTLAYEYYEEIEDIEIKEKYRKEMQKILNNKFLGVDKIGHSLNMLNYTYFIENSKVRKNFVDNIDIYKINNYFDIKPNIKIFRAKNIINKIIKKIQNQLIK